MGWVDNYLAFNMVSWGISGIFIAVNCQLPSYFAEDRKFKMNDLVLDIFVLYSVYFFTISYFCYLCWSSSSVEMKRLGLQVLTCTWFLNLFAHGYVQLSGNWIQQSLIDHSTFSIMFGIASIIGLFKLPKDNKQQ